MWPNANIAAMTVENDGLIFRERDLRMPRAANQISHSHQQQSCEVPNRHPSPPRINDGITNRQTYVAQKAAIVPIVSCELIARAVTAVNETIFD